MTRFLTAGVAVLAMAAPVSAETTGTDTTAGSALARFFTLQETGWIANLDLHRPRDAWNSRNRDITVLSLSVLRSWEFRYGLELQAGGGLFIARGTRNEPGWSNPIASDAYGVSLGGTVRWYAWEFWHLRPFGEATVHVTYTPSHPFPAGGSAVNGYLRAGGGLRADLTSRTGLEAGYHLSHLSNGGGLVPGNPAYNGHGFFLNLRWRD